MTMTMEQLVYAVNCVQDILFSFSLFFLCLCFSRQGEIKIPSRILKHSTSCMHLCEPNNNESAFFQMFCYCVPKHIDASCTVLQLRVVCTLIYDGWFIWWKKTSDALRTCRCHIRRVLLDEI